MTIKVGTFTGEKNKIEKTFNSKHDMNCTLKQVTSVSSPVILVKAENESTQKELMTDTYAYIPDFGRYYYIRDRKSVNNGLVELDLVVDPLKSFATKIYAQTGFVDRTASKYQSSMIKDDMIPTYANPHVFCQKLEPDKTAEIANCVTTTFSKNPSFVIITAGPSGAV